MHHMVPVDQIPLDLPLLEGIDEGAKPHVLSCLQVRIARVDAGDTICSSQSATDFVACLLHGHAIGVIYDEQGNRSILHEYGPNQTISCGTVLDVPSLPGLDIFARDECTLVYFSTKSLQVQCEHCQRYVRMVLGNLARSIAALNSELMVTMDIRRRRSSRGKILAYLEYQAQRAGSTSFDTSFNRQELADYLGIDRAALSRELSQLQDEGQVSYSHNHFELHLKPPQHANRTLAS